MRRGKINFNAETKLKKISESLNATENLEDLNLLAQHNSNSRAVSFRLRQVDLERLDDITKKLNIYYGEHPCSRTMLIKGLLMFATTMPPKKIWEYIRKSL